MSNLTLEPTDFRWPAHTAPRRGEHSEPVSGGTTRADTITVPEPVHPEHVDPGPVHPELVDAAPHGWGRLAPEVADVRPMSVLTSPGHRAAKAGSLLRTLLFVLAGAAPILSIPAQILGVPFFVSAVFAVVPLGLAALLGMFTEINEGKWARTGMITGLVAVTAYDAVRMPLVISDIWPDFIPDLGGWLNGVGPDDVFLGYLWRYLGDGGGMGMVFFMVIGLLFTMRPNWIIGRTMTIGIGYGVFIWSGLVGALMLPGGQQWLFTLSPTSFVLSLIGHLIYGAVLGLGLRLVVRRLTGAKGEVPATA